MPISFDESSSDDGETLAFRPMKDYRMEDTAIVVVHDASFRNVAGMKSQQNHMRFATERSVFAGGGEVHFLD